MSILLFVLAIIAAIEGECVSDTYMVIWALFSIADALWMKGESKKCG